MESSSSIETVSSMPTTRWFIANAIGVVVLCAMQFALDAALGAPDTALNYLGLVATYVVVAVAFFYADFKSMQHEEQKTVVQQVKDMASTFGVVLVLYVVYFIVMLHTRQKAKADMGRRFTEVVEKLSAAANAKK